MAVPLAASLEPLVTPIEGPLDVIVEVGYGVEQVDDITSWNYISGGLLGAEVFPGGVGWNGGTTLGSYCPSPSVDPNCHTLQVPPVGSLTRSATLGNALATFQWDDAWSYWWFEPPNQALDEGEFEPGGPGDEIPIGYVCIPLPVETTPPCPTPPLKPDLGDQVGDTLWDGGNTVWDHGFTTWE